jgi:hypothetical protein
MDCGRSRAVLAMSAGNAHAEMRLHQEGARAI